MELIIKEKTEVDISRRKKREKKINRSIFEIYRSEKTIKDYFFYLKDFLNYIYEGGDLKSEEIIPLMLDITTDDIEDYIGHLLEERELKKTSVNKIISALKSLYRELEKQGMNNPIKHIELFKTSRNLDNILKISADDIREIIDKYFIKGEKEYRNIIILYTLFYTGMRSSELLNLKFGDLLERNGNFYLRLSKTKSGKEQYKPLHQIVTDKLMKYREYIQKLYFINEEDIVERYVFASNVEKNTKLSYSSLYEIIQNMGKTINKDMSPHNIRHSIATELSLNGADILEIRDFLGHSDTKVTEVYINAKSLMEKKVLDKVPEL